MDGFEAPHDVRLLYSLNDIPILYTLTEMPRVDPALLISTGVVLQVMDEGVQHYLTHPWKTWDELIEILAKCHAI